MITNNRCYVGSEIGQLHKVIVHRPDLSLKRLTPSNSESMLFDDVLQVEKAAEEHDVFTKTLRDNGVEVFLLKDLLTDVCKHTEARDWILARQCSAYYLGTHLADKLRSFFSDMSPNDCAKYLLGGITRLELTQQNISLTGIMLKDTDFIIPPLPNHLFTRDTSCWIYDGLSINPMAMTARKRETINLRAIYQFHPLFSHQKYHHWYGNNDRYYERATLEGGDILVLGKGLVMIGLGERSTPQAVELLTTALFKENAVRQVIIVELPKNRAYMHLDTVTTMLDHDCFTTYPPVMNNIKAWQISKEHKKIKQLDKPLYKHIAQALGVGSIRLIPTGGNIFEMEREQWNDANNVLAVRPGVVIGYDRNIKTIDKMEKEGITVLTIPGDELGRGRGGPRCMSCPFLRDPL